MSLISITGAFREIVIREFISYCEKAGSDIDNVMLSELGGSFCDTKHNISKDMTPNKDQKKKGKKKDDITPDNFSRMPEVVVGKCMARTFAKGFGAQCSRNTCADSEDYCTRHMKSSLESNDKAQPYPALGRIDKPRCACRLDNGHPLGWRLYLGTGPVEEICEEFDAGVGVGDDISIPESEEFDTDHVVRSISAQNLVIDDDDDDDTLSPEPEIIISEKVVEENAVENNVVEETVVEDTVVEENVVEEKVVEEKVVEENKFPKMGLFQGVKYLFGEENIHGENPVMIMGYKGQTSVVGTFTDDEVILNEEYESTHEFSATDPEQDDVIWIGKSISQDIYGFPK